MNDSWIAFVDQHGLKSLVLESRVAEQRGLHATCKNAQCYWVILEPQHARFIDQVRAAGNSKSALQLLNRLAIGLGQIATKATVLPVWQSDDVTIPDRRDRDWSQ